ncbi:MFS transporter [soil metagenome]
MTQESPKPETRATAPLRRPEFRRLLGISVTVALGFGMVIPVLPLYAQSFGVSLATIGLIQVVFGLTRFSFGLVGGLVVDRFGVKLSTIAGLLIVAASSYASGFAATFPQLVIARGVGGAGSALFINGLTNQILRIIEPEAMGRAMGPYRSSFLVGIAIGPLIGGFIAELYGPASVFIVYATGLLVAAVVAYFVMEARSDMAPSERSSPLDALRFARPLFTDVRFVIALLATFAGWWTLSGPAQWLGPIYARQELGFSKASIGPGVTLLAVGEIVTLLFIGKATDVRGRRAVIVPALAIAAIFTVAMGQVGGLTWAFYPLMMMVGAGVAASSVAAGALLADSTPRRGSGAGVGVNQMAGDLGYLIAPTSLGWVAEKGGFPAAYALGAVPALAVAAASLKLPRRSEKVPPKAEPAEAPDERVG